MEAIKAEAEKEGKWNGGPKSHEEARTLYNSVDLSEIVRERGGCGGGNGRENRRDKRKLSWMTVAKEYCKRHVVGKKRPRAPEATASAAAAASSTAAAVSLPAASSTAAAVALAAASAASAAGEEGEEEEERRMMEMSGDDADDD